MISAEQRKFIHLFVIDGEFDWVGTCRTLGFVPSQVMPWFRDDAFQAELRKYQGGVMAMMGYGPLLAMQDTLAIAHSDISQAAAYSHDLASAPRHVRVAVREVEMGVAIVDGKAVPYAKKIKMHDKAWALKQAADWYSVGEAPEVKKAQATTADDGPKRIAGLIVRPPLTQDEKDIEDMLS